MEPRDYQAKDIARINEAHRSVRNLLYVLPCRAGKTVVVSKVIQANRGGTVAIAHRTELVCQLSRTLAKNGILHRVVGSLPLIRLCVKEHLRETGKNWVCANASVTAASVDTLVRLAPDTPWLREATLAVVDEAHHLLSENKWGKAMLMLPNARLLGVTATPRRSDGKGLGCDSDGLFDQMIEGVTMTELMSRGFIAPYRLFAPRSDINLMNMAISASGDYSPTQLRDAVHASHIIGDVVDSYLKIAPDKLGMVFCVDVAEATAQAAAFRAAGISAEVLSADDTAEHRAAVQAKHQKREVMILCNVGLFSEGVDIPMLEVVIIARPTASFALWYQMFCRVLNPAPGKVGIVIDHVGNTMRHGVPDAVQVWSMARAEKVARGAVDPDVAKVNVCPSCLSVFDKLQGWTCPYCGEDAPPAKRSEPKYVEGDLAELDPAVLAALRGQIDKPIQPPWNAVPVVIASVNKRNRLNTEAQLQLRDTIAQWAAGKDDIRRAQREFYGEFGIDVLSAQALNERDANNLTERVKQCGNGN